ncbi:MAG: hypothetical protein CMQ70_00500 [Gammaproteobacteria bacterium]|nr:hypothetical protein [Gammaproteobacteria bacterium]
MHTSNIIAFAVPVFTLMILCEFLYGYLRKRNNYRLNDTVTSIGLGLMSRYPALLGLGVQGLVYAFVSKQFNLGLLASYDPYVWVIAFVLYDLSYYWLHRSHHQIKVLWASHVVHHHGEEYNLSTALRQTGTDFLFKWIFYTPMLLLGIPVEIFVTVAALNLIYQFWVHTEHIKRLGILDYILVTPSNHRIHHAQNKEYIDANYGGVFILWDRMFGTFIDERDDLKPIYGTSKPLKSWNPLWANLEVWSEMIKDTWRTKRWRDKIALWFSKPKWRPEDVSQKYPIKKNDLTQFRKFDTKTTLFSKIFGFTHLVFVSIYTQGVLFNSASIGYVDLMFISFNTVTLMVFASFMYENRAFVYYFELIRSLSVLALISAGYFNFMPEVIIGYTLFSSIASAIVVLRDRFLSPSEAR